MVSKTIVKRQLFKFVYCPSGLYHEYWRKSKKIRPVQSPSYLVKGQGLIGKRLRYLCFSMYFDKEIPKKFALYCFIPYKLFHDFSLVSIN